jgi:hypothetical protein
MCGSCIGGTAALGFTLDYPGYFEGDGIGGIKVEGVYALCLLSQLGLAYREAVDFGLSCPLRE